MLKLKYEFKFYNHLFKVLDISLFVYQDDQRAKLIYWYYDPTNKPEITKEFMDNRGNRRHV